MDVNLDLLLDYIYQKSSLNFLLKFVPVGAPHFSYETFEGTKYISLENHRSDICVPAFKYSYGPDEKLLQEIVKKVQHSLEDDFFKYIEQNCLVDKVSFYKDSVYKPPSKYFKKNTRFSLKSRKIDFKKGENVLGIIEQTKKDIYDYYKDERLYVIVSPEIANFMGHNTYTSISQFYIDNKQFNDPTFLHPFAVFSDLQIYVNPRGDQNTMYFGTMPRFENGFTLFYHKSENSFLQYTSMPNRIMDMEKTYLVNLYYKIVPINTVPKFKKIILEI